MSLEQDFSELARIRRMEETVLNRIRGKLKTGEATDAVKPKREFRKDQAVKGQDLQKLPDFLGISVNRTQAWLGLTTKQWYEAVNNPDLPLSSDPLINHVRLIYGFPGLIKPVTDIKTLREILKQHTGQSINNNDLAKILGPKADAISRWVRGKAEPQEQTQRLMDSLLLLCEEYPIQSLDYYLSLVEFSNKDR